jgi:hypothetical protein
VDARAVEATAVGATTGADAMTVAGAIGAATADGPPKHQNRLNPHRPCGGFEYLTRRLDRGRNRRLAGPSQYLFAAPRQKTLEKLPRRTENE